MSPPASLLGLLRQGARRPDLASLLAELSPAERVEQVLAVTGRRVDALFDAAADGPPATIEDFVPADAPPETTIIFEGRNSLPLFSRFQKRFARLGSGEIVGYNHQPWSPLVGPGYFVVKPAGPAGPLAGHLFLDYVARPGGIPAGWPPFRPNEGLLSRPVWADMKDYMRRVAPGVLVGKAYRRGWPAGYFFVLVRAD
ncbi:MAG: hypothetical protein HY744_30940 [Deltaproteobacteria bacterium]|nr:hypothetical protein [Deltaproteobacteria bacterium]